MRRLLPFLLLAIFPATAYAQTPEAGTEADALAIEIDRDFAQLQAADCDTACRALDSMRRATDRLCTLDPGDRCAQARRKLADATTRVRGACPSCAEASGQLLPAPEEPKGAPAPASNVVAEETVEKKSGGCSGCSAAPDDAGVTGGVLSALLLAVLVRRRRRSGARAGERRAP